MDLVAVLKKKIDAMPDGDHVAGLRAVVRHVEVGFAHLQRGQDAPDETAFTDAVYRSNQAFEGGIKEAYRVLAGKSPDKVRPFDIENYLDTIHIFRPRVLALFTNYRKEWRNPSTHDYKLDFDEGEALLACVSVAAFACLVSDQIAEQLAFLKTKQSTGRRRQPLRALVGKDGTVTPLAERIARELVQFATTQDALAGFAPPLESQMIGAVSGYLTARLPKDSVQVDVKLAAEGRERADLLVNGPDESIVIELKHLRVHFTGLQAAIAQLEHYMAISDATSAILYLTSPDSMEYELTTHDVPHTPRRIYVVSPKKAA